MPWHMDSLLNLEADRNSFSISNKRYFLFVDVLFFQPKNEFTLSDYFTFRLVVGL